jgi:hypothetical protein
MAGTEFGVGPKSISHSKLSLTALAAALDELVSNESLSAVPSSLGAQIRAENGIDNAVRGISQEFS